MLSISKIGLYQGGICIQFEIHSGDGFVVGFAEDGENGGKRYVFNDFVDVGRHNVSGIDHGPMPDEGEIKFSNN